jgi:hypothetical protein
MPPGTTLNPAISSRTMVMTDESDDHKLASDMIDVHGREAAIVARENARAAALAGQAAQAKFLDPGAWDYPAGW